MVAQETQLGLEQVGQHGLLVLNEGEVVVSGAEGLEIPVDTGMGNIQIKGKSLTRIVTSLSSGTLWVGVAEGRAEFIHEGGVVDILTGYRLEIQAGEDSLIMNTQKLSSPELEEILGTVLE